MKKKKLLISFFFLVTSLLLDRIDKGYDGMNTNSDSDTGSDLLLHNDLDKVNNISPFVFPHVG